LEAIVLAGGFGTRLQQIVQDVPKSMAMVNGRPFIEFLLNYLSGQGVTRIIFSVGYKKETIQTHLGEQYKTIPIEYVPEDEPLGTGGGIKKAFERVEGKYAVVLNGDSMFRTDLNALRLFHEESKADITLALRYLEDTERFGTVVIDADHRITGFSEKQVDSGPGFINGGIYIINKEYLLNPQFPEKFSIEKDCFEKMFKQSMLFGFPARGYFLDIGIPEDFYRAQHEFRAFED
jgi:D-glycero-alpha-D-manno-heptose 1-phosphate guanylyltransferase